MQYQQTALKVLGIWLTVFLVGAGVFTFYPNEAGPNHLAGIHYQKALMKTLTQVSAHQTLATRDVILSKKSSESKIDLQVAIDASFDRLEFLYGKSLRFDLPEDLVKHDLAQASIMNIKGLKQEWENLRTEGRRLKVAEVSERHRMLLKRLRVEAVRTAQIFELEKHLHPADSELVRIVTQTIPEIYEHMSEIKALAPKYILTEADRTAAASAIKELERVSTGPMVEFDIPLQDFIQEAKKLASSESIDEPNKIGSRLFHSEKTIQDIQLKGLETLARNMKAMLSLAQE